MTNWLKALVVQEKYPTIILLQEATTAASRMLRNLGYDTTHAIDCVTGVRDPSWTRDTTIVSQASLNWGMPVRYVMQGGAKILIANVHLPSRTRQQDSDVELRATYLREYLMGQRKLAPSAEVVAGDFNLVPYNKKMTTRPPDGLGGHRCVEWIGRKSRRPAEHRELLNATWRLEGRTDYPLASYHYGSGTDAPWFQYDQIMLSSELFASRRIEAILIDSIASTDLTKKTKYREPDPSVGSDHLPVLIRLI